MKAGILGLATTLLVWIGLGLTALGLAAQFGKSCMRWCPGDPDPAGRPVPWDSSVCHEFYWDSAGVHDVGTGTFCAWSSLPYNVPPPAGPVPTETSYLPLPPWCP
jgi:hypothetical protein